MAKSLRSLFPLAALFGLAAGCSESASATAGAAPAEAPPAAASSAELVARGKYLVDVVAGCVDCHTPHNPDGSLDMTRYLAGVDCFLGAPLGPEGLKEGGPPGCVSTRNLTDHETGLKNRTDAQILDMMQKGVRPDGKALHLFMPYWLFANFEESDARAVVAYLRTVPGVEHQVKPNEAPWADVAAPAPALDMSLLPPAAAGDAGAASGRYLATIACFQCHTPTLTGAPTAPSDPKRAFAGGRFFSSGLLEIMRGRAGTLPKKVFSLNLTPHETGIAGYTAEQIVAILKDGKDREGKGVCPPMPAGAKLGFGGLTDKDARDIAAYLKSLPPIEGARAEDCVAPDPSAALTPPEEKAAKKEPKKKAAKPRKKRTAQRR